VRRGGRRVPSGQSVACARDRRPACPRRWSPPIR
jgi:hypothetical protein